MVIQHLSKSKAILIEFVITYSETTVNIILLRDSLGNRDTGTAY
jgi:hypothetical protein